MFPTSQEFSSKNIVVQIYKPRIWVSKKIIHLLDEIEISPDEVKLACGRSHILQTFTLT